VAFDRNKAWETSDDGIILEDGTWLTSGAADPTHDANVGDRYWKTNGTTWFFNTALEWEEAVTLGTVGTPTNFQLSWAIQDFPYLEADSSSFIVKARFQFDGTDETPAPTTIECVAAMESGEGQVRVFDLTNGNVIATSALFSNTVIQVVDLGAITNLPTAEAVFEMQAAHNPSNPGKVRFSSVRFL